MNLPCSIAKNIFVFLRHHPNYFQPPMANILKAFSEFPLQNHLDILNCQFTFLPFSFC